MFYLIGILASVLILFALISPKVQTKRILRVAAFVLVLVLVIKYCSK